DDMLWRLDGDALVGIAVTTEHLTMGSLSVMPGKRSSIEAHGGDECLYVTSGALHARTFGVPGPGWYELRPGDGFYCPEGVGHQELNVGRERAAAVFGVAPRWHA